VSEAGKECKRVRANTRRNALLTAVLVAALCWFVGCDSDVFGPDTPTTRFNLSGVVTSGDTGKPIGGVKVFLDREDFIVDSGALLASDTAVTDQVGNYHLETKYYCSTSIKAMVDGYGLGRKTLNCLAPSVPTTVNFVLQPDTL
jgi:hypothetical protein